MSEVELQDAEDNSLFDALARLVPEELQAQYYRVIAHTQSLSPDDEMLRILEAMGILALVTRHTPNDIATERERFAELLEAHLQASTKVQKQIVEFGKDIDDRLADLPREIELGLNPQQISRFLGETLRQHFAETGIRETVSALNGTTTALQKAHQQMTGVLKDISDPHYGVAARVNESNRRIDASVEARATRIDALLRNLRMEMLRVWLPIIALSAFLIGYVSGCGVQRWRDTSSLATPIRCRSNTGYSLSSSPQQVLHWGCRSCRPTRKGEGA